MVSSSGLGFHIEKTSPERTITLANTMMPFWIPRLVFSMRYPATLVEVEKATERMSMSVEKTRPRTSSSTHCCIMTVDKTQLPAGAEARTDQQYGDHSAWDTHSADHEVNKSGNDNQVADEEGHASSFSKALARIGPRPVPASGEEEQSKSKCGAKALDVSSHGHQYTPASRHLRCSRRFCEHNANKAGWLNTSTPDGCS